MDFSENFLFILFRISYFIRKKSFFMKFFRIFQVKKLNFYKTLFS